jgi:hypothetical protein
MTKQKQSPSRLTILVAAIVIVRVFAAGLALDLANQGLAWRIMWSLTGEEKPASQLLGMVDWLGNITRVQPTTAPDVPIQHVGVNPYGINTFLEQEVEQAKRERQVQMIADAGFHWVRQEIPWEDIEIHGRGDFMDRRNVESIGEISAWDKYDHIIDLLDQYGLEMQARIDHPPAWTRANPVTISRTPPDDVQDYVNFVTAFAERYKGRVHYYQIWNEPNIYPEWGDQAVDPEAYTDLLCRSYAALKAVDPANVVISAALSPTNALTARDLNEFIYLQRMYDAGAQGCFDIMATQGYGFFSGPTDSRMRPTNSNFARPLYLRDVMVANGDADKPIWISEAAWNPVDAPEVPPDLPIREQFGSVTRDEAARYMPLAYERAAQEWHWIGVINYWFFKRPSDADKNQPYYYFRMVEPDFTPLPVYESMKQYIANTQPVLYAGVHQGDDWAIQVDDSAETIDVHNAQFGTALKTHRAAFTFRGTSIHIRWIGLLDVPLQVSIDGEKIATLFADEQPGAMLSDLAPFWTETTIFDLTLAETHTVELISQAGFDLDSVTVYDRTREHLTPVVLGGAGVALVALCGFGWALWKRVYG